jgi:hypothetical protein
LELSSIVPPATAVSLRPLATALSRSGAVVGARSNCLPTVGGSSARIGKLVSETSRPLRSNTPLSLATHSGSQVATGT